jgi:quinohemoprotein ethanol dehydrogenase
MVADTTGPGPKAALVAWDPVAQKQRWRVAIDMPWNGGVLATAGDVVFMGTGDGWFTAYNALTGARLWRSNVGMGIIGAPSSYSIAGKQYVSVLAGYGGTASMLSPVMNVGWKYSGPRRLVTFTLGGTRSLPKTDGPTMVANVQDNPAEQLDPKAVGMGKPMFMACAACHGINAVSAGGPAPDLRESAIPLDKDAFFQVVHDGALLPRGMPKFQMFTPVQIEALRQYIRSESRKALARK